MYVGKLNELTRRAFLRRTAQLASVSVASSYAMGLGALSDAAAFTHDGTYKALVCIFLYGGNDHANTLIPYDSLNYARYSAIRGGNGEAGGGIALPRASLANTTLQLREGQELTDGILYALAPTMPHLKKLFDTGQMAPILNVGPLIAPITKAQFESGNEQSYPRPAKLFSHNDQQSTWQSFQPEGATVGWGGKIGDLALSSNTNSMFTAINATGNAVFISGSSAAPYRVSTKGPVLVDSIERGRLHGSATASTALKTILERSSGHVLERDYAQTNARSIEYGGFIQDALDQTSISANFGDESSLAQQLSIVARLISARENLGVTRQVFLVSMGGFDNHNGLIGKHEYLLGELDFALNAFHEAMRNLGLSENVTSFTASDFGRTLSSNGDGSDHGWGGHHFVVGGAVNGGQFYGRAPSVSISSDDQVKNGRLLPSTSVDQYAATLARWFGVAETQLTNIAPNLGRFDLPNLGFMHSGSIT